MNKFILFQLSKIFLFLAFLTGLKAQNYHNEQFVGKFEQLDTHIYLWRDVSNVYVIKDNNRALLIDLGNGSVLDHLSDIGIEKVDWVLFTHHHREQSQGYPLLKKWKAKVAVPEEERLLFEKPTSFRKMDPSNSDPFSVVGASYVRPALFPIQVDRSFAKMDTFTWHNFEFRCMETKGNSPGSMSYFLKTERGWNVFSGDLMLDGGRMHNFFDTDWDYGFASGIFALHNAAAMVKQFTPHLLLPSHGAIVEDPVRQLEDYQAKLANMADLLVQGYPLFTYAASIEDEVSVPTIIPYVNQVSPHVYKFKGHANFFPNFTIIIADSGRALVVDCGLIDEGLLETAIRQMEEKLGLKKIDAVLISHMHGDHFLQVPFLKEKYGAEVWALDRMVPQIERPLDFNYSAMIPGYNKGFHSLEVDREFKDGETFEWEEFTFTVDWMPGQTEFAMCLQGMIDGKLVAFTGDNIRPAPNNRGNPAVVAHNSTVLEEGYIHGAEYLAKLNPDRIVGGHSVVIDHPRDLIERYRQWSYELREAFQSLSNFPDYRFWFDPFWVKAEPYRKRLTNGKPGRVNVVIRNFVEQDQIYKVHIRTPKGIISDPEVIEVKISDPGNKSFPVELEATEAAATGVGIISFDLTLNGELIGEWFDSIIYVE
ncbi:Glyoxylase, beta-lactamase superfamily II [Cyclobacterium lianum]|uniref:Glyoxylase, beta-lactamase superfamily II n=1 Tax=Cyclobacterium lianum TaxID=388280 RepID=A0A1M7P0S4_9BACT|nr:MBL fold metallo-hydrolase [Cyclobacterium lianum]SHN10092.1 Glyoxylase, beta-lactamase superfamily II [Cyclobacterium lianum]